MRVLQRLRRGGSASSTGSVDPAIAAANTALEEWSQLSNDSGASLRGQQFLNVVQLLLAVPIGEEREALVRERFKSLIEPALLPGCGDILDQQIQLLCDAPSNTKELADSFAGILAAISRDAKLERATAELQDNRAKEGADRCEKLAIICNSANSSASAQARCTETLRMRRLALHQVEMLLGAPKRAAEDSISRATERQASLKDDMADVIKAANIEKMKPLDEVSLTLEHEINTLQERSVTLRRELSKVTQELSDCNARQRAHMTQVDCWRLNLEDVKTSTKASQREAVDEAESVQARKKCSSELLEVVQSAREAVQASENESCAEMEQLCCAADLNRKTAKEAGNAISDDWLKEALAAARQWRAEDTRALQSLELMGVTATGDELPTRQELPAVLYKLHGALDEREELGDIDPQLEQQAKSMLEELASVLGKDPAEFSTKNSKVPNDTQPESCVSERSREGPTSLSLGSDFGFEEPALTPLTSPINAGSNGSH